LRRFADECEPVRLAIQRRKSQLFAMPWAVVPAEGYSAKEAEAGIKEAHAFFSTSGGMGGTGRRFRTALNQIVDDMLVLGAFCAYRRPTVNGGIHSVEFVDAATIKPLLTPDGWVPEPPEAGYEQYVGQGRPKTFTRDELWYEVWDLRTYSRWSRSPVEYCLGSALQFCAIESWNLSWFADGDGEFGYWQVPDDWSPAQIREFNLWVREMNASLKGKQGSAGATLIPGGPKRISRRPRREAEYAETALLMIRRIAAAFDLNATVLGFEGDQYKVSQEGQSEAAERWGNKPLCLLLNEWFSDVIHEDLGIPEADFQFDLSSADLEANARVVSSAGTVFVTPNDGRRKLGLEEAEGPYVDTLFDLSSGAPVVLGWTKGSRQNADNVQATQGGAGGAQGVGQGDANSQPGSALPGQGDGQGEQGGGQAGKTLSPAEVAELARWQRKVVRAVRDGKAATGVAFTSELLSDDVCKAVASGLAGAGSEHDARQVFAKVRGDDLTALREVHDLQRLLAAAREEQGRRMGWPQGPR
jgi:hypothetical protein